MTGQVLFDSHVATLLATTVSLVDGLTPGMDGGRPVAASSDDDALRTVVSDALLHQGYDVPPSRITVEDARLIAATVAEARAVLESIDAGDLAGAARRTNGLLRSTGARPQLDGSAGVGWSLHFHGPDDSLGVGWAAGIAAGLAMALGTPDSGRLGICGAEHCDRAYLDTSRNGGRRFCSTRCQSRMKAAAHRARRAPRPAI